MGEDITAKRAAFLTGHGTLTLREVGDWAVELGAVPSTMASGMAPEEPLMVAVVNGVVAETGKAPYFDPEAATAREAEAADIAAGLPPRRWRCECGAEHSRGHFFEINTHRCLTCGYTGQGGTLLDPPEGRP